MFGLLNSLCAVLLQVDPGSTATPPVPDASGAAEPGGWGLQQLVVTFGLMYAVVYFLLIRPQKRQQKEHQKLLEALKKNDQVQTAAGFFGKVVSIEKDQVIIKIDESSNTRMRILRSSIVAVLSAEQQSSKSPAAVAE
ncbi:MAG: preprotein translocase subunit YajC [Planctomycetota bacterium]